jgi:tetratricopeptide (TPR) repeat protein
MLAIWMYLRYQKRSNWQRYLMVCLAFALGLMAKLMIVTLPFVLLLLDYWPLGRLGSAEGAGSDRPAGVMPKPWAAYGRLALEKVPLLLLSAASLAMTFFAFRRQVTVSDLLGPSLGERISHSLVAYVLYIGKIVWPTKLAVFYPYHSYAFGVVCGAFLLLGGITVLAIRARHRFPWFVIGWLWYLGIMLPVIGIVRTGEWPDIANRFTYLPAIGLFVIAAWGGAEVCRIRKLPPVIPVGASLLVLASLFALTVVQTGYWRNDITLFGHAVAVSRDNGVACKVLGMAYMREGKEEEALRLLRKRKELVPESVDYDYAVAYFQYGRGEFAAARDTLRRAFNTADNELSFLSLLAQTYEALHDNGNAIDTYNLIVNSKDVDSGFFKEKARQGLARLLAFYAPELDQLRRAVVARPGDMAARGRLALRLDELGFTDEAFSQYLELEKRGMKQWQLYYNIANAAGKLKRYGEAERYYELTLAGNPTHTDSLNNLGLIYKETGRYDRAIEAYQRAIASSRENAYPLYNLGMLYLKTGKKGPARDCFRELSRRFPAYADRVAPFLASLGAER